MTKEKLLTPEEFKTITELAGELELAKTVEAVASADRIAIEAKLAVLIPGKEEGQRTINLDDKRKVVVTRGLNYKSSAEEIEAIEALYFGEFGTPIKTKSERVLDVQGYKWYEENRPEDFAKIAKFVSVKPKKTSVTVKPAKK